VVVTAGGCELLTRFPADQLYVAGTRLFTGAGLPGPAWPDGDGAPRESA